MMLKSMELQGFKSFSERTRLDFERGITCIVGPNGAGKSNIADAIRWVLGEQSAKQLRGGRMEDIIFSGTDKRKALSFSEVALTFDNSSGELPVEYSEVTVQRRVYRSGESEYYINKNACRLRDIVELFRDTGIGKDGYSIIGQGRVEEIIDARGEGRRAVFEDAAGISKYKARKHEAQRKLEQSGQNMARLLDISLELEEQLAPLSEQSEQAKRYLSMRDELKGLEINRFLVLSQKNGQRLERLSAQLAEIDSARQTLEDEDAELRKRAENASLEAVKHEAAESALREAMLQKTSELEQERGRVGVEEEKLRRLAEDAKRLRAEAESIAQELERSGGRIEAAGKIALTKAELIRTERTTLGRLNAENDALAKKLEADEAALEERKRNIIGAMNRLSDINARKARLEALRQSYEQREGEARDKLSELNLQADNIENELGEAKARLDETVQAFHAAQKELELTRRAVSEAASAKQRALEAQQRFAQEAASAKQRLTLLNQMQRDYEGYAHSVRKLMDDCAHMPALKGKARGVVAELIEVPKELERAVEVALGGAVQHIVTNTEEDARDLITHLKRHQYGRATFLPLTAIKGRGMNPAERRTLGGLALGVCSELISCAPEYKELIENLLGRTAIVRNMDDGIKLARMNSHSFRIVTLEGDVINPGGSMSGGSAQSRLTSLLGRERAVKEAQRGMEQAAKDSEAAKKALALRDGEHEQAAAELKEAEQRAHMRELALTQERERERIVAEALENKRRECAEIIAALDTLDDSLKDIVSELDGINLTAGDLESGSKGDEEDVGRLQSAFINLRERKDALGQRIADSRVRLAALEKDEGEMERDRLRHERERERLASEKKRLAASLAECEASSAQAKAAVHAGSEETITLENELASLEQNLKTLEAERTGARGIIKDITQRREELAEKLSSGTERAHRLQMQAGRLEQELQSHTERMWDEYEFKPEDAESMPDEIKGAAERIELLRTEIRGIASVNVNAIEDYIRVKTRYDELQKQRGDIETAAGQLGEIISQLEDTMRRRFLEQFDIINENFKETFVSLFRGGSAELSLADRENALDSDIDIIASPPGKKLELLSLLSGGEKTLTAIALLFAMLRLKPTPFCVLDEIDAALDESNVGLFASFLSEYAERTQFIVVTHHKGTMEAGDVLYGVTMEEKGVSKLISMRLADIAV